MRCEYTTLRTCALLFQYRRSVRWNCQCVHHLVIDSHILDTLHTVIDTLHTNTDYHTWLVIIDHQTMDNTIEISFPHLLFVYINGYWFSFCHPLANKTCITLHCIYCTDSILFMLKCLSMLLLFPPRKFIVWEIRLRTTWFFILLRFGE